MREYLMVGGPANGNKISVLDETLDEIRWLDQASNVVYSYLLIDFNYRENYYFVAAHMATDADIVNAIETHLLK